MNVVEKLNKLDLSKATDRDVRLILKGLDKFPILLYTIRKGMFIYRSVKMTSLDERFSNLGRISYNPSATMYGRANIIDSPVFYGSMSSIRKKENRELSKEERFQNSNHGFMINASECTSLLNGEAEEGREYLTIGMWEIMKDIELIVINNPNTNNYLSEELKDIEKQYYEKLGDDGIELLKVQKKLGNEFTKKVAEGNEFAYKLSANYSQIAKEKGHDGILYSSVKVGGEGFNVALNPNLIDNGTLQLKRAGIVRFYQSKEKQVVWDWYRNAEHISGEDLKYNKIEGVTLSEDELLEKLEQYKMEHLIDQ